MPTINHTRSFSFERRVRVDLLSLAFLAAQIGFKLDLTDIYGTLSVREEEHTFRGLSDLRLISTEVLHAASRIVILFRDEAWDASAHFLFYRVTTDNSESPFLNASSVEVKSQDETQAHLFKAIVDLYEHKYVDEAELSRNKFTASGSIDIRRIRKKLETPSLDELMRIAQTENLTATKGLLDLSATPNQSQEEGLHPSPYTKRELSADSEAMNMNAIRSVLPVKRGQQLSKIVSGASLLVLLTAAGLYYNAKQAKSSESLASQDGSAEFSLQRSTPRNQDPTTEIWSFVLRNTGKSSGREIALHCGSVGEPGPIAQVGTMSAGETKTLQFVIDTDPTHINHQSDFKCRDMPYITYKDATGSYIAAFDSAGSERTVEHTEGR